MGAIIKISKKSKLEDVRKALLKLAGSKKSRKKLSDFYGALPNTFEDGLTYQQKQRNEWK
jgi:hypothetical protein